MGDEMNSLKEAEELVNMLRETVISLAIENTQLRQEVAEISAEADFLRTLNKNGMKP